MPPHRDPSWGIKSMPTAERELAVAAAKRHDTSQGEWLAKAIRTQLALEAGELVPAGREGVLPPDAPDAPKVEPGTVEEMARVCAGMAASGLAVPQAMQRLVWQRAWERLAGNSGWTPRLPRPVKPPALPDNRE
jgi:hypothetical protein